MESATGGDLPGLALLAATAMHAGFQLTVTVLVYPTFRTLAPDAWAVHHASHSRRITPLVVTVYVALLASSGAVLLRGPSLAEVVAMAALGVSLLVTALVAAPAHRRLERARDTRSLGVLVVSDRVRCGAALVAVLAVALGMLR